MDFAWIIGAGLMFKLLLVGVVIIDLQFRKHRRNSMMGYNHEFGKQANAIRRAEVKSFTDTTSHQVNLRGGRATLRAFTPNWTSAFTLVELLVVIAIIAILAGILLPSLSRAKASAHSAVCKNHLKQMGIALHLYTDDFRSCYPSSWNYDQTNAVPWANELYPSYQIPWDRKEYHCPDYTGEIVGIGRVPDYLAMHFNLWGARRRGTIHSLQIQFVKNASGSEMDHQKSKAPSKPKALLSPSGAA